MVFYAVGSDDHIVYSATVLGQSYRSPSQSTQEECDNLFPVCVESI